VHALDIDSAAESLPSDEVWHSASTGEVPILVTLMRAVAAVRSPCRSECGYRRTAGRRDSPAVGDAVRADCLRDVAQLMMRQRQHAPTWYRPRIAAGMTAAMRNSDWP